MMLLSLALHPPKFAALSADDAARWDVQYSKGDVPWQSGGLSPQMLAYLGKYPVSNQLLEIGCGCGDDAAQLAELGYIVTAIDFSNTAIHLAKSRFTKIPHLVFSAEDMERWTPAGLFNVVYEKGLFHNASSPDQRDLIAQRISEALAPEGIWLSVCGSADGVKIKAEHGAIYLQDLISIAEIYFEVLEIVKAPYLTADFRRDFDAWHCAFRRR